VTGRTAEKAIPLQLSLLLKMVPLVGARPPPVLLMVAGGRTDTTMTAVRTAAAALVMTRVARVTVATEVARRFDEQPGLLGHPSSGTRLHATPSSGTGSFVWDVAVNMK